MKGVLVRVEQKFSDWCGREKAIIWLFVRGEDKRKYVFQDPFFEPYCYFRRGLLNVNSFSNEIRKHKVVTILGKSYLKVWTDKPNTVAKLRNIIEHKWPSGVSVYEADVRFPLRYIIDKMIRGSVEFDPKKGNLVPIDEDILSNLRIHILDIELLFKKIICLTIWDSYDETYYTWYWRDRPITKTTEKNWKLDWSTTEEEMLTKVLKFMIKKDPDVVTGFNVDFDLIWTRKRVLDNQLGKLWDQLNALGYKMPPPRDRRKKFRDFWVSSKHQRIPGRNVVDLMEILLKTEKHQLSEFNLDFVARNYLKPPMEKLKWKGKPTAQHIHEIWPQDPFHVLKYNKIDVELCVELNRQQQLIPFADDLRKFVGCQLDDIFSNKRIAHVELLRKTKRPLPVTKKETRRFKGGMVIEPMKGVYKWIIVMDFSSLYPSIIIQLNIDPDTYISEKARYRYNITNSYILKDPETKAEFWFKKGPEGDLPAILRNYLSKRKKKQREIKKLKQHPTKKNLLLAEVYDTQQYALKVITNAFYGSLLYRGQPSAWMCARAITSGARQAIRFAKEVIEKLGYSVIYGDTDSIMITSKFSNYRKVVEEAGYLSKRVAKEMPKFLKTFGGVASVSLLNLALDKVFKNFLIDEKKKRYAGIPFSSLGEGKLEVKGFGTVRSDTSKFTADLQRTLLKEILRGRDKKTIQTITELELATFEKRPLTEIGVPCVLTKDPSKYKGNAIQKKAFGFSNKYLKTKYGVGDKPKRIYVKMKENLVPIAVVETVDVVAYDSDNLRLPPWLEIDFPKVVIKSVKPKIDKVLGFVELEWKDIKLPYSLQKKKKRRKKRKKLPKGQKRLISCLSSSHV